MLKFEKHCSEPVILNRSSPASSLRFEMPFGQKDSVIGTLGECCRMTPAPLLATHTKITARVLAGEVSEKFCRKKPV